jgi:hypothetical protein
MNGEKKTQKKLATVKIKKNLKTRSFMQTNILKIKESNKNIEAP